MKFAVPFLAYGDFELVILLECESRNTDKKFRDRNNFSCKSSCDPYTGTQQEGIIVRRYTPKRSALSQFSKRHCLLSDSDSRGGAGYGVG